MDASINLLTCHVGYSPLDKYSNGSSDRLGNGVSGGNGSLDTLMADLMSSLGSDIHETDRRPSAASSRQDTCAACGDEFDYRDDVVNHHNQVWLHTNGVSFYPFSLVSMKISYNSSIVLSQDLLQLPNVPCYF